MRKIFLDMDGVIADFDKRYFELFKTTSKEIRMSRDYHAYNRNWKYFIELGHFMTLDKTPEADVLLATVAALDSTVMILSSSADHSSHKDVLEQKMYWLRKYNIKHAPIIVPGRRYKKHFAEGKGTLLIDDHEENVREFREAGGSAIHHYDINITLNELYKWRHGNYS